MSTVYDTFAMKQVRDLAVKAPPQSEFEPNEENWSFDVKEALKAENSDFLEQLHKKLRQLVPYKITY